MKIAKKSISLILCVIMAFSSIPLFAAAQENEAATGSYEYSTKYYTEKPESYGIGQLLDEVDTALAGANIYESIEITKDIKFVIDLRDVNALCGTLDSFADLLDNLLIQAAVAVALGDLKDLDFSTWKTGMARSTANDAVILKEIVEFVNANSSIISGIVDGTLNLGLLKNTVDLKTLLGEDGVSGIIKEALFGVVYSGAQLDTAYAQYKDNVDSFIYGPLLNELTGEYLKGFTMTSDTTVEDLLVAAADAALKQYAIPALKSINEDFSTSPVEDLRKLAPYINLKGSTYDLSGFALDADKGLLEQLNDLMGVLARQIFPGCEWESGDYTRINDNLEAILKHLGKASGLIPDAEEMSFDRIVMEVVAIVLRNLNLDSYADGIEKCDTLEELLKSVLITAVREDGVNYTYTEEDSWLVVLGDLFATWAYNYFDIRDLDGKPYRGGKGEDIWTALNYFLNYFLFDKNMVAFLGISVSKEDSYFTKIDKLIDLFGESKKTGVNFSLEKFLLGGDGEKGLIDSALTLDLENLFTITFKAALDSAGDVKAEKFLYNTVCYFLNNWSGEKLMPAYKQGVAFTNALDNTNIASLVSGLLKTLNTRKNSVVSIIAFICALVLKEVEQGGTFTARAENAYYTGLTVHPDGSVTLGGEKLVQDEDYVVFGTGTSMGSAWAVVKLIGIYEGSVVVPYNIVLAPVSEVRVTTTDTKVRLRWDQVPGADRYNVYMGDTLVETVAADAELTKQFTALTPMTRYNFKVEAVSDIHGTAPATEATALTNPPKVGSVKVTSVTASTATLSWKAVPGADGYVVERYSSSKKAYVSAGKTTSLSYTVKGLYSYTSYDFRVKAYFTEGEDTVYSASATKVSARTKMGKVENLKASSKTSSSITLSWDKVRNAKGYRIEQYINGKWTKLTSITGTSYTVKGLKASSKYYFRVRAYYNSANYGSYSDKLTVYTNLPKVTGLTASSVTTSSVKLSWKKVTGATSYVVYRSTDGKTWKKIKTTTATSYTATGLYSGKNYQFKVVAYSNKLKTYGDYSSVVKAVTTVGKVENLKASSRKKTSITVTWDKERGASGYVVYVSADGKKWTKVATTTKNTATASKLTKNKYYYFKVRAYSKATGSTVYGSYSATLKAKTTLF